MKKLSDLSPPASIKLGAFHTMLAVLALFVSGHSANAQVRQDKASMPTGAYIGFGVGATGFKLKKEDFNAIGATTRSFDERDTGFKVFGGYRLNENLAIEGQYTRLGKAEIRYSAAGGLSGTEKYRASSLSVAAVGSVPVTTDLSLFAKAGPSYNSAKSSFSNAALGMASSGNKLGLLVGVGASYKLTDSVSARVEFENFSRVGEVAKGGRSSVTMVSAGLAYQF